MKATINLADYVKEGGKIENLNNNPKVLAIYEIFSTYNFEDRLIDKIKKHDKIEDFCEFTYKSNKRPINGGFDELKYICFDINININF